MLAVFSGYGGGAAADTQAFYVLPAPRSDSNTSVEQALVSRRSRRSFHDTPLSIEKLSQILWAAYGITDSERGFRTAPSAGALFPLEIYVVVGNVTGLSPGVYKYVAQGHKIIKIADGDIRAELAEAAIGQPMPKYAPATVVYTAVFDRTVVEYGVRGRQRYVFADLGHSAQNIHLQAETLGLGTVAIGAFTDERIKELLHLPAEEEPLYLMPIGYAGL